MDLVGHDVLLPMPLPSGQQRALAGLLFLTGVESHPAWARIVPECLQGGSLPVAATQNRLVGDMSDHHIFRTNGVPYLFLSCGRWEHYHRITDTPDRLNYAKMALIRDYLRCLIRRAAAEELVPSGEVDSTALEIRLLKDAFGSVLAQLLMAVGLSRLETRIDLDNLAMGFQAYLRV
jgi:hypothetical protein